MNNDEPASWKLVLGLFVLTCVLVSAHTIILISLLGQICKAIQC